MGKHLSGSANTGKKIIENWDLFKYEFDSSEQSVNGISYKFQWNFDGQYGYISITYDDGVERISNSSLIDTDPDSKYKFSRPLGLYNDSSLFKVFKEILKSQEKEVEGIF